MQVVLVLCSLGLLSLSEQAGPVAPSTRMESIVKKPSLRRTFLDVLHHWVEVGFGRRDDHISSYILNTRESIICALWIMVADMKFVGPYEGKIVRRGAPSSDHCTTLSLPKVPQTFIPKEVKFDTLFRALREHVEPLELATPREKEDIMFVLNGHIQRVDVQPIRLAGNGFDAMVQESVELRKAVVYTAAHLVSKHMSGLFPKITKEALEKGLAEDEMKEPSLMFPILISQVLGIQGVFSWAQVIVSDDMVRQSELRHLSACLSVLVKTAILPGPLGYFIVASASIALNGGKALADDSFVIAQNLNKYFSLLKCTQ